VTLWQKTFGIQRGKEGRRTDEGEALALLNRTRRREGSSCRRGGGDSAWEKASSAL